MFRKYSILTGRNIFLSAVRYNSLSQHVKLILLLLLRIINRSYAGKVPQAPYQRIL
jgi:hypothetical protein